MSDVLTLKKMYPAFDVDRSRFEQEPYAMIYGTRKDTGEEGWINLLSSFDGKLWWCLDWNDRPVLLDLDQPLPLNRNSLFL